MKAVVLHVNSSSAGSNSPTMRIARFVSEELQFPLVHDKPSAREALKHHKFDVVFVKLGILKFSDHREEALEIYSRAKRVVNLENDCTFQPDNRFRRDDMVYWSTVDQYEKGYHSLVNWNVLTWMPPNRWRKPLPFVEPEHKALLYYGAYKTIREESFRRFMIDAKYPMCISSFRGKSKFQALIGRSARAPVQYIGAFRKPNEQIPKFPAVLCLEDDIYHTGTSSALDTFPANRFYECLQLGVAQFFDSECERTFDLAGIDIKPFMAYDKSELRWKLKTWRGVRENQRAAWHRDYTVTLRKQIQSAYRKLRR